MVSNVKTYSHAAQVKIILEKSPERFQDRNGSAGTFHTART